MQVVVTGGGGFIGSHVVDMLVAGGDDVRVFDDLSTGHADNVDSSADLVVGDVADEAAVCAALNGADAVVHLAAHRSVERSVQSPLTTDTVNVHGTLVVLRTAQESGVRRVVAASSSSVYGGAALLPTPEGAPLLPRSPYAVSKLAGEHYCRVFAELYGLPTVSLRFFNVYGPRQRPESAYAAVIPLFIAALRSDASPVVHGDGRQSRDFTYATDAARACVASLRADSEHCAGKAYNVAGGRAYSLLELLDVLGTLLDVRPEPHHVGPRPGDVRHTRADISAAHADLGHVPEVGFEQGLRQTVDWFASRTIGSARRP